MVEQDGHSLLWLEYVLFGLLQYQYAVLVPLKHCSQVSLVGHSSMLVNDVSDVAPVPTEEEAAQYEAFSFREERLYAFVLLC